MSATAEMTRPARPAPVPHHGIDTPTLFATLDVVRGHPALAQFQFRADSKWLSGTHMQSTMHGFYGVGAEQQHKAPTVADGDHPAMLCGSDEGPTPVEWVLHALAACLTAGIANIAAARGVTLTKADAKVVGDIDLQGVLGLNDKVRNGFQSIRVTFEVAGDAPAAKLEEIVRQSVARSAVFDMLTNGVPVAVSARA